MELKRIDFNENKFEANGKVYHIHKHLSIGRYCEFEILQTELAMGMTVQKLYDKLGVLRNVLNQARFVDAAVLVADMTSHMVKITEKEPTVLKICTLFINTEDEDLTVWNNDLVVKKIDDWKKSGIDYEDFFHVAFNTVPGFFAVYNTLTQLIMEEAEKGKEGLGAEKNTKK